MDSGVLSFPSDPSDLAVKDLALCARSVTCGDVSGRQSSWRRKLGCVGRGYREGA